MMTLLPTTEDIGYINGITLEMETIEDSFSKAIAEYEYPYADGSDLEDMGQKARTVKVRCYFFDNDSQKTYDAHKQLINILAVPTDLEFWHPKYGPLKGKIREVSVRADDRLRTAEVDFTFVEQRRQKIWVNVPAAITDSMESAVADTLAAQEATLTAEVIHIIGVNPVIAVTIPDASLLSVINVKAGSARGFVRDLQTSLGHFSALAADVVQPVNSLIATISFAATLPGRFIGTVAAAVERVATLYTSLQTFPARLSRSLDGAFNDLLTGLEKLPIDPVTRQLVIRHATVACAQRLALELAYSYHNDQTRRQAITDQPAAFDILGRYVAPAEVVPVANAQELEASLADARGRLAAAVSVYRDQQPLKDMARLLLEHVYTVKLERERIITIQITNPTPLHIICLAHQIPYADAERIIAINRITDPSAVTGPVQIYV